MDRFGSRRQRWLVGFLVGVVAVGLGIFVWVSPACACTPVPDESQLDIARDSIPSAGRLMRDLALAQERYHSAHAEYASLITDLGLATPGWKVTVVETSPTSYRMRITSAGQACALWGGRTRSDSVLPVQVDCGSDSAALGARRGGASAPHN